MEACHGWALAGKMHFSSEPPILICFSGLNLGRGGQMLPHFLNTNDMSNIVALLPDADNTSSHSAFGVWLQCLLQTGLVKRRSVILFARVSTAFTLCLCRNATASLCFQRSEPATRTAQPAQLPGSMVLFMECLSLDRRQQ